MLNLIDKRIQNADHQRDRPSEVFAAASQDDWRALVPATALAGVSSMT